MDSHMLSSILVACCSSFALSYFSDHCCRQAPNSSTFRSFVVNFSSLGFFVSQALASISYCQFTTGPYLILVFASL
jgi:hypothetical protein